MNKPKLERYPEVTPEKAVSVRLDAADSAKGTWFESVYLMAVNALRRAPLPDNKALTVETNADRIRAMSNEELTELLWRTNRTMQMYQNKTEVLDWLSRPVEED